MTRRRSILITAAVIATGLVAWTKSASLGGKCRQLRTSVSNCHFHRRREHGPNSEYRLALSPAQLERARAAMEELYRVRVCARCEHCTPAGICTCPASDQYGRFVQSMSRCMSWAERNEPYGDCGLLGRKL